MGHCGSVCHKSEDKDVTVDEEPWSLVQDDEVKKQKKKYILPPGGKMTVMMFGMTGAGKSSLGNLIADSDIFAAGDDTASITNLDSVMRYEADDGSLILLDTIGLGDTELNQEKVAGSIRDVALSAPNGVDVLLYVMRNARITDDAIARLIYVTQYLWGDSSLLNLYIVVTCASRYLKNKKDGHAWIKRQVEVNWRFKHIFNLVGKNPNRFIFVDNPSPDSGELEIEPRRNASYDALFRTFCKHPRDAVPPFTQAMMREVQEMVKVERQDLDEKQKEVVRIQQEIEKTKASKKGQKTEEVIKPEDEELQKYLTKAKADMLVAQRAMKDKLDKVKQDSAFQQKVNLHAERATLRFEKDFKDNGGARSAEDAEKIQAAKKMLSSWGKRIFGDGKAADKSAAISTSLEEEKQAEEVSEAEYRVILAKVKESTKDSNATATFTKLGGWEGAGAIAPFVFARFLLSCAPGITPQHVGGLWWRADTNGDGQIDLEEFQEFFDKVVHGKQ